MSAKNHKFKGNMKAFYKITFIVLFCALSLGLQSFTAVVHIPAQNDEFKLDKEKFVERHNYYRKKVGVPPVEWSDELAVYADGWAKRLAQRCQLQHRKTHKYGENICKYPSGGNEYKVVDLWASEEQYFNHKKRTYRLKGGEKYGHYSQIIWAKTTKIGAAVRMCKDGSQIWVCNYDPPGNYIDAKVY